MTHGPSLVIWFIVGKLFNVAFESDKSFIEYSYESATTATVSRVL